MCKFQFPSNGKAHPNMIKVWYVLMVLCASFNSLQTGKHIQTSSTLRLMNQCTILFQFPSNGKAHPNTTKRLKLITAHNRFNSLQTGKHIQTIYRTEVTRGAEESFNSLQTGKHIQTSLGIAVSSPLSGVSIPFKRESTSKRTMALIVLAASCRVSIPFKRESTSKPYLRASHRGISIPVSIPFKRESTSKQKITFLWRCLVSSFNSLQTGKHIQTKGIQLQKRLRCSVSIPFKRESTSKLVVGI